MQIPESVLDKTSPAYNKGRAWINFGSPAVAEEYSKVSKKNLLAFFTNRALELAAGGLLFVMCLSRKDEERKEIQFGSPIGLSAPMSGLFELAWQDLVDEVSANCTPLSSPLEIPPSSRCKLNLVASQILPEVWTALFLT